MSSDRSRRRDRSKAAQHERENVSVDRNADEALRSLVRVLAQRSSTRIARQILRDA